MHIQMSVSAHLLLCICVHFVFCINQSECKCVTMWLLCVCSVTNICVLVYCERLCELYPLMSQAMRAPLCVLLCVQCILVRMCLSNIYLCVNPPGGSRLCCDQPAWHKTIVRLMGTEASCSLLVNHRHLFVYTCLSRIHWTVLLRLSHTSTNTVTHIPQNTKRCIVVSLIDLKVLRFQSQPP